MTAERNDPQQRDIEDATNLANLAATLAAIAEPSVDVRTARRDIDATLQIVARAIALRWGAAK